MQLFAYFLIPCCSAIFLLLSLGRVNAQPQIQTTSATFVRVFFRDKGPEAFRVGTRIYEQTRAIHADRSLRRRAKVLPANALLSVDDAPVYEPYLDTLRRMGASIALRLRWRNYAVVTGANLQFEALRRLPFVRAVQSARERLQPLSLRENASMLDKNSLLREVHIEANCGTPDYGAALRQLATVTIPEIHALGISGQGVQVGMMDSGFRWRDQVATKGASVLAEYDFIQNDSTTANASDERRDQDAHGTECFSILAGYDAPKLIGAAFGAFFLLAKTEDLRYERNIEQDNYAAGLEWLEARGVDIMTASLGYSKFDSTDESSPYGELDGKTTIVTRAVNDAAKRGVVCVIPAGNDGRGGLRTLNAPADADSAITVGGIREDSLLVVSFSSRGPTADGRIKPDVVAQAEKVVQSATTGSEYRTGNGTSYSTPIVAGGIALLLSAFPELKPWEIRQLLTSTASQSRNPDNFLGYGIANFSSAFRRAIEQFGFTASQELLSYPLLESQRVGVSVAGASGQTEATLFLRFAGKQDFTRYSLGNGSRFADIPHTAFSGTLSSGTPLGGVLPAAEGYALVSEGGRTVRIPREGFARIQPRQTSIPCGINVGKLPLDLPENVQECLFPNPVSRTNTAVNVLLPISEPGTLEYRIISTLGQVVGTGSTQINTGINIIPINISAYSHGVYFVQVQYNSTRKTFRCVISP